MDKSDYQRFIPETKFRLDLPCPTPILKEGGTQNEIPALNQETYQGEGTQWFKNIGNTTYTKQEK